jgi:membrane protease YdiL (CAAX protease family)
MPEKEEDDRFVKYCVYCGAKVEHGEVYCPNCGKLLVKEPKTEKGKAIEASPATTKAREVPIRKCSNCGALIKSPILKQCPICNNELEELPPYEEYVAPKKPGFIFTDKKLEPEEEHTIKRGKWNLKEGTSVFTTSLLVYITTMLLITLFLMPEQNILGIIISQLPEILIGLYPIWYIKKNRHSYKKLGFNFTKKNLTTAIIIGVIGGIGLIFFDFFSEFLINVMLDLGLRNIFDINPILMNSLIIKNAELYWFIILTIMVSLAAISSEILFRGTLHNALKERFGYDIKNRLLVILIVAIAYSGIYAILSFPTGLLFFPIYFLLALLLGIIYEAGKGNLVCPILASVIYNISSLIILLIL